MHAKGTNLKSTIRFHLMIPKISTTRIDHLPLATMAKPSATKLLAAIPKPRIGSKENTPAQKT